MFEAGAGFRAICICAAAQHEAAPGSRKNWRRLDGSTARERGKRATRRCEMRR
jgi:hypothetical protein